ncbi:hypothetical protein HY640_04660 [Candidatus Woesearchaeota archaeon]|nr:hypothetical protein [Candidatus Woesearchaeota archaeon]
MLRTNNKASAEIIIQSIFAIFLVIFLMLAIYFYMQTRTQTKVQEIQFDEYELSNKFLIEALSGSCIAVEDCKTREKTCPLYGVIDAKKIDDLSGNNQDIDCADNQFSIYMLKIKDDKSGKEWVLGATTKPEKITKKTITLTAPVTIQHDKFNLAQGTAELTTYTGDVPMLIGKIKQACNAKTNTTYRYKTPERITYKSTSNKLTTGEFSYYPKMGCAVSDFEAERGEHLAYIQWTGTKMKVTT